MRWSVFWTGAEKRLIRPEVSLYGWRDVKLQELNNSLFGRLFFILPWWANLCLNRCPCVVIIIIISPDITLCVWLGSKHQLTNQMMIIKIIIIFYIIFSSSSSSLSPPPHLPICTSCLGLLFARYVFAPLAEDAALAVVMATECPRQQPRPEDPLI